MQDLLAEKNRAFAALDALERDISHRWLAHQKRGKVSPPPAHWYERRAELHGERQHGYRIHHVLLLHAG